MQQLYNADGSVLAAKLAGYSLTGRVEILTGTTSYTPTSGTFAILVELIAGGGSGGGGGSTAVSAAAGGGGGGGGYSASLIVAPGVGPITVAVGAGGLAPTAGNNVGNAGNDTSFNSGAVLAKAGLGGGAGGTGGTTPLFVLGGAGGASGSGVGDVVCDGAPGGASYVPSGTVGQSGRGANGPFGGGATERIGQSAGATGGNYGSGGSGGLTLNGGAATAGGAGAPGLMIIWEFA